MDTRIQRIDVKRIRIPFKVAFRHASATRDITAGIWVEITNDQGLTGYGEGCPRDYVTGETLDSAADFIQTHRDAWRARITSLATMQYWMAQHPADIDANPAAWCAVELALLDLMAKTSQQPVETLLGLPGLTGSFHYSAILGDSERDAFENQYQRYRQTGFTQFKLKLSGDLQRDQEKLALFRIEQNVPLQVRADANNLWSGANAAIQHIQALNYPFVAIEEPIKAKDYTGMQHMAEALQVPVILDESFTRIQQFDALKTNNDVWFINIRVSKMGGLLRSLAIIEQARASGIRIIIGAQVGETSLLTRAALTLANASRDILFAQEGAFGNLLLEQDLCEPMLIFGKAGELATNHDTLSNSRGFGLNKRPDAERFLTVIR